MIFHVHATGLGAGFVWNVKDNGVNKTHSQSVVLLSVNHDQTTNILRKCETD